MFTLYDKGLGVLWLVPKLSGVKVEAGKVLLARKKKNGGHVTDAYNLKDVRKLIPAKVLKDYGWIKDDKDLKDVFKEIESKTIGNKTIILGGNISLSDLEEIDESTPIEQIKGVLSAMAKEKKKSKGLKVIKLKV